MPGPRLSHLAIALEFVLVNFAAPIAFFCVFEARGPKPAIAVAVGVTVLQLLAHRLLERRPTPFFLTASGFTLAFGSMDLVIRTPQFFRLEPFAQNLLMGIVFLATVLAHRPIVEWFARHLPEFMRPDLTLTTRAYLRGVTLAWSVYFIAKALLFLYLAFHVDLGRLVILRTVIGGSSLGLMFLGEVLYRKWFRMRPEPK